MASGVSKRRAGGFLDQQEWLEGWRELASAAETISSKAGAIWKLQESSGPHSEAPSLGSVPGRPAAGCGDRNLAVARSNRFYPP